MNCPECGHVVKYDGFKVLYRCLNKECKYYRKTLKYDESSGKIILVRFNKYSAI